MVSKMAYDINDIIAFENGDLDEDSTINLFQELVDSGAAWTLQGSYGRMANAMLEAGLIHWADRR